MRRFGPRDITLYLLLGLMIFFAVSTLQQMDRANTPTYSQIRTLFLQEQVEYFTLEDNTLTLTLRGQDGTGSPVHITCTDGFNFSPIVARYPLSGRAHPLLYSVGHTIKGVTSGFTCTKWSSI